MRVLGGVTFTQWTSNSNANTRTAASASAVFAESRRHFMDQLLKYTSKRFCAEEEWWQSRKPWWILYACSGGGGGCKCIGPVFLNLGTRLRWVVRFTPRPPCYPTKMGLAVAQNRSARSEDKWLAPARNQTPVVQLTGRLSINRELMLFEKLYACTWFLQKWKVNRYLTSEGAKPAERGYTAILLQPLTLHF
jgi:hypothetical protein